MELIFAGTPVLLDLVTQMHISAYVHHILLLGYLVHEGGVHCFNIKQVYWENVNRN